MAKQALSLNSKLKEQLQEFEKIRYEVQVELMQTGKNNEEKEGILDIKLILNKLYLS